MISSRGSSLVISFRVVRPTRCVCNHSVTFSASLLHCERKKKSFRYSQLAKENFDRGEGERPTSSPAAQAIWA